MPKSRHEPVRSCVACRQPAGKQALIRYVRNAEGEVVADLTGRAPGRGAYLHADLACQELARKRGSLLRALPHRPAGNQTPR